MWALEENGQFEDALDAAERTLALDPNNTRARFGKVRYLPQLERLDEATAKFTSLKAYFPDKVELLIRDVRIALPEQSGAHAVARYRTTVELHRTNHPLNDTGQAPFATPQ